MKKRLLALLLGAMMIVSAAAEDAIPEELLHEALMTLCWNDDHGGECWTEGHVVLGEREKEKTVEVYAYVFISNYGFMDGVFTDTGGGAIMPVTVVFDRKDNGYSLRDILEPEDGTRYWPSVEAMFPAECVRAMENGAVDRAELVRQQHEQAQAYLDAMGRTEQIQDWRERNLQLADMLVHAANEVICFYPPYPLWVTTVERVEDGLRYTYERTWQPDSDVQEGYVYILRDGSRHQSSGVPGTQMLTKTRCEDGAVMETITIRADLYELCVKMEDANGSRTYTMTYDGETYHRPSVTEDGNCAVYYEEFERNCASLPE